MGTDRKDGAEVHIRPPIPVSASQIVVEGAGNGERRHRSIRTNGPGDKRNGPLHSATGGDHVDPIPFRKQQQLINLITCASTSAPVVVNGLERRPLHSTAIFLTHYLSGFLTSRGSCHFLHVQAQLLCL